MAHAPSKLDHSSAPRHASVYDTVTTQVIASLERGVVPWRKPWKGLEYLPCNAVSGRPYRGVNLFLLSLSPFADHRWVTFRQAQSLGGSVQSGEHSSLAVFWKKWEIKRCNPRTGETEKDFIPLLRVFRVFNVEQCLGLRLTSLEDGPRSSEAERLTKAESLIGKMPCPPQIREGGKEACYIPARDLVQMPPISAFSSAETYYGTLLHELAHSTGHERRLGRPAVMDTPVFGSGDYGREELVAELASAYCCASLGLDTSLIDNAASYIGGWLRTLRQDAKAVVAAATLAQRAADYIRGVIEGPDEDLYPLG